MKAIDKLSMLHMVVTDMDKSKEFYTGKLGFTATKDYGQGGMRWVSLELPGGGTSIILTTFPENLKAGTMKLFLSTDDVEASFRELKAKGVETTTEVTEEQWAKYFRLEDPDGNHLQIMQS